MPARGQDILKVLQQMMQDDIGRKNVADQIRLQQMSRQFAAQQHAYNSSLIERGVHGEPIKNVTEATIVASETNPLPSPPQDTK